MSEPKKRILVVDDSDELQESFRDVLEDAGYEVSTASSGEEGFEKAKATRPDLILLDLIMPGIDGFEVMTRLRSDLAPPIPPTILCSGFDLTEEEALRRGALMFLRKPVGSADLREFVSHGLLGQRVSAETAARERTNNASARARVRQTASDFVSLMRREVELHLSGQMEWLAAYFAVESAVTALMDQGRLTVLASSGDKSLALGIELASRLPPVREILESQSSLVLADASTHVCFSKGPYRLPGVRFFAGVPLFSPDNDPIGVICVLDSHARVTQAEDLISLELMGRQGSLLLRLLSLGRPESQLPGRFGSGMLLRPSIEVLVDTELRLLRRSGGSMEVAVLELDDPSRVRDAVMHAESRERLAAGSIGPTRVAVYKRHPSNGAASEIQSIVAEVERNTHVHAVGSAAVSGSLVIALTGHDLLRLAELELEEALLSDNKRQRLVMQHDAAVHPP